jgi:ParB family chromosome partitioning protein
MTNGPTPFKKPARLGRGLSALVGTNPPVRVDAAGAGAAQSTNIQTSPEPGAGGLVLLPVDSIRANPSQPRRHFDDDALIGLAESIRQDGVMQPVVVRRAGDGDGYELVAGERRLRASKLAGLETIPAILREADDRASAELALIENLQRADLNPVERALAFRALADRYQLTHAQIGERVGMDRASVSNHLRLLDLDDEILSMVGEGRLGFGHARALLGIADGARRLVLARLAAEDSWSVRAVERAAAEEGTAGGADGPGATASGENSLRGVATQQNDIPGQTRARAVLDDMERRLSEHLGTRVILRTDRSGRKGTLTLEFFSLDQFDGLLERLGYSHHLS